MNVSIFSKATSIINSATTLDKEDKKEEAVKLYLDAAEILIQAIKSEVDVEFKTVLRGKVAEILERCEHLKTTIPPKIVPKVVDTTVTYKDIIGLDSVKRVLRECTSLADLHPELFKDTSPAKKILLFGPPGTGKTMLAKAMANECKRKFFSVSSSDVMSKWQGESEQNVRKIFEAATAVPSILFIDEVDALFSVRSDFETDSGRRIKNEFLTRIQGFDTDSKSSPIILAATNVPWNIDPAFRRRFEKRIYIPLPSYPDRVEMFKKNLVAELDEDVDFIIMAKATEGYSASDIYNICRDMTLNPVNELQQATHFILKDTMYYPCTAVDDTSMEMSVMDVPPGFLYVRPININDFKHVKDSTTASVNLDDLQKYTEWEESNKRSGG